MDTKTNFEDVISNAQFNTTEGKFAKVGDIWKSIVFFWQHERIYYITEGTAILVLKGQKLILKPSHLYYIPSNSVVTAENNVDLGHYYLHFISADQNLYNMFSAINLKNEAKPEPNDILHFQRAIELINKKDQHPRDRLELNGIMQILISRFLKDADFSNYDKDQFELVLKYIDENFTRKITIKDLALIVNLNEVYFSSRFKKVFGMSPSQYILNKKITHAMYLLKNSELLIKEISYKIGFDDELYFSRIFKNKTGLSPKLFRESSVNCK